jgi:hypothetical protein
MDAIHALTPIFESREIAAIIETKALLITLAMDPNEVVEHDTLKRLLSFSKRSAQIEGLET